MKTVRVPQRYRRAFMNLHDALDPESFRTVGRHVIDTLTEHLHAAQDRSQAVLAPVTPEDLLRAWDAPFPARPADPTDSGGELVRLVRALLAHSNHLHHPGYIGHQVAVPVPAAPLVELTNALLNNGMAVYEMGQLQTVMERRVVGHLARAAGFGPDAGGVFTHGGSLGNFTA
ncbi:MAG: pyridoxal-dependent decarboxylase, partial [bacterium]|nr:pyridoxal-dependent decarboxylase [bacterium]